MNPVLKHQIIQLCEQEQSLRKEWCDASLEQAVQIRAKINELDQKNTSFVQEVVDKYGWPGFSLVGEEGSHSFFVLVQHSPDLSVKNKALGLFQQAVTNHQADPSELALLIDRVRVEKGEPQIYGTQIKDDFTNPYPIEDEENLEKRRKEVGLCPMKDYLEGIKNIYSHKRS